MTTMAVVADSDGYFGQHLFGVGAALLTRRSHKTNPLINLRFVFVRGAFWTAVRSSIYMEGLKAMGMVKMHDANQLVKGELLGLVKQRQRGGVATGLDLARLEGQLANERQQIAAAQYEVQRAKFNLANLLGFAFEIPLSLTDEFQPEVRDVPVPQGTV